MGAFIAKRQVKFRDTDAAGIMHFSVFLTYMEEAEHEFLRSLGKSVKPDEPEGHISWPRVSVHCDYKRPLKFEQSFEILVSVSNVGTKSVTYQFEFQSGDEAIAKGEITAVCCWIDEQHRIKSVPIPDDFIVLWEPYRTDDSQPS